MSTLNPSHRPLIHVQKISVGDLAFFAVTIIPIREVTKLKGYNIPAYLSHIGATIWPSKMQPTNMIMFIRAGAVRHADSQAHFISIFCFIPLIP